MTTMTADVKISKKLNHEEKVQETRKLAEQGLKHCRKCDQILRLDSFQIYIPKKLQERGWGDGHHCYCKDCSSAYYKKRRANSDKIRERVNYMIRAAKKAGKLCDLTVQIMEDLFKKQNGLCEISHKPMTWVSGSPDNATITRFNPNESFIQGNVVWCRNCIAKAKMTLSYETYLKFSQAIVQNQLPNDDIYFSKPPSDEFHRFNPELLKDKKDDADKNTSILEEK